MTKKYQNITTIIYNALHLHHHNLTSYIIYHLILHNNLKVPYISNIKSLKVEILIFAEYTQ